VITAGSREIAVSLDGLVATVEIRRRRTIFFDSALIGEIAERSSGSTPTRPPGDRARRGRPLVLRRRRFLEADGHRHDSGGRGAPAADGTSTRRRFALFRIEIPVVGAIHGAAIGGGLGLALMPDFG